MAHLRRIIFIEVHITFASLVMEKLKKYHILRQTYHTFRQRKYTFSNTIGREDQFFVVWNGAMKYINENRSGDCMIKTS